MVQVGEGLQVRGAVVADREDGVAGAVQSRKDPLQLDQLRLAVGSPNRAAMQDHDRATHVPALVQIDQLTALVGQPDVRERLADLRPAITVVELACHRFNIVRRPAAARPCDMSHRTTRSAVQRGQRTPRSAASICCVSSVSPSAS